MTRQGWLALANRLQRLHSLPGGEEGWRLKPRHSATESNPSNPRWNARARRSPPPIKADGAGCGTGPHLRPFAVSPPAVNKRQWDELQSPAACHAFLRTGQFELPCYLLQESCSVCVRLSFPQKPPSPTPRHFERFVPVGHVTEP